MGSFQELFSVEHILAARGLKTKVGQKGEPPFLVRHGIQDTTYDSFYDWFRVSLNRYNLLKLIDSDMRNKNLDPSQHQPYSAENIRTTFPELTDCTFDNAEDACRRRFSATIEWLLGEILIREFHAFSYATGLEISALSDADTSRALGDFDVVSVMRDMSVIYIECKSGGTDFEQIRKATRRSRLLGAATVLIVLDKKTGNFDRLKQALSSEKHPVHDLTTTVYRLSSYKLPQSEIYGWGSILFVPITAENLVNCLRTAFRFNSKMKLNSITYEANFTGGFGIEVKNLFNSDGFCLSW